MNEALDGLYRIAAQVDFAILVLVVIAVEQVVLIYFVRKGQRNGK